MYEVYWMNYNGREEEAEFSCGSLREAEEYIENNSDGCSEEEGYIVLEVSSGRWIS